MTARILHVSDLHVGGHDAPEPVSALRELAATLAPELVLATGDLAHRGRRSELERAAELLRGLGTAVLAVPGNHDIPYTVPARFTRTYAEWERVFGTTEPVFSSERLFVTGSSSVRPWRQQSGALTEDRAGGIASRLGAAAKGTFRLVAFHHHLAAPPWRAQRKRPLKRRDEVLHALTAAGAELIVGGHVHQAGIAERREFQALDDAAAGAVVLATAPGVGRPRPGRRGEARGVNVYEADADQQTVRTFAWDGHGFVEVGRRTFRRG